MRILLVNPNTTAGMTANIAAAARRVAAPGTEIVALTSPQGPASIEGYYDEAMSLAGLLQAVREAQDYDAVIIACFDDTGLDALRCLTDKPVVGIGEAGYRMAAMLCNLMRYGMDRQCQRVRSSEVAVLELEHANPAAYKKIEAEIGRAITEDRAEAIVLGCAGMADLAGTMSERFGVPVLDGLVCAVGLVESMVRLGLRTSRVGGYAPPPPSKRG